MLQRPQLQQYNQPTPPTTMSSGNEKGALLAQDPRQQQSTFDLEPNPFEQSFAVKDEKQAQNANQAGQNAQTIATPGGRRHMLPPVAAITSPASLVQPTAGVQATPGWDSLRTGPLSSGMLQGPQHQQQINAGAGDHLQPPGNGSLGAYVSNLRRSGFPINESGLRTGLTPGGSGSMFPTPGPTTAAILGLTADPSIPHSGSDQQKVHATSGVANVHGAHPPNGRYEQSEMPVGQYDAKRPVTAYGGQVPLQQQLPPQVQQVPAQMPQPPQQHRHQQPLPPPGPPSVSSSEPISTDKEPASKRRRTNTRNSSTAQEKEKPKRNTRKPAKREVSSSPDLSNDDMDDDDDESLEEPAKKGGRKSKLTDEEKRKSFLERNRIAALKCRQRKKQWLKDLQQKVEYFQFENEQLNAHVAQMRDQILQLKSIVLQHKACPGMQPEAVALAGGIEVPVPVSQAPVALTTTAPPGAPMMVPVMTAGVEPSAAAVAAAAPPQVVPQPAGVWAMQQ